MFNDVFVAYNNKMFDAFVERTKEKYHLQGDSKEVTKMIIEYLKEEALKNKESNMFSFGFEDEALEKGIIKAFNLYPQYAKSKEKKKDETPRNKTIGDNYYDKNGQKHIKKKKEEPKEDNEFDLTQLGLFDLD